MLKFGKRERKTISERGIGKSGRQREKRGGKRKEKWNVRERKRIQVLRIERGSFPFEPWPGLHTFSGVLAVERH